MQPIFEAKYLAIEWFDKNIVSKISESISSIKIELENATLYNMEIQTYTRIENGSDGQIAFHIFNKKIDILPYFINANNEKINLIKIEDPQTKKNWWIEDGSWKKIKVNGKEKVYLSSDLWNHAGETKIYFDNITCHINISAISFTKEQLELYLEDFKNDFWYLILKKNSLTSGNVKNSSEEIKILNNQTLEIIKKFIQYIQNILKNPKKELKETKKIKDIKNVKPIAKTFIEIASVGMKRKLTSRDTIESYNIPENKYIYYIFHQVYTIIKNMTKTSQYINNYYQNKIKSEQKRVEKFTDTKTIDKKVVENTIKSLQEKITEVRNNLRNIEEKQLITIKEICEKEINKPTLQEFINQAIQKQNIHQKNENNLQTIYLQLKERKDYKEKMQFKGTLKLHDCDQWYQFKNQNDSYSLDFDKKTFDGILQENKEYKVIANIIESKQDWANYNRKGTIYKRYFKYIEELKPLNYQEPKKTTIYRTIHIKLNKKQDKFQDKIQFWGNIKIESQSEWHQFQHENTYSLEFNFDIFNHILQENTEYKISAYIEENEFSKPTGSVIHKIYFKYITKIEQISNSSLENELNYYLNQKKQLEQRNWVRPLNSKEKTEQEKEKEGIKKQIQILTDESQTANEYIKQLDPLIQILKNILNQFNQLSIVQDSYFPNSMTFIQNPNYQGAYKYYELIKNVVGINESLFISIQKIDKIGILDIPTLYERWCFLQIIKVLMDQYNFLPEEDWKKALVDKIVNKESSEVIEKVRNIPISFENPQLERKVVLHYEKELNGPNSKRPDYVLEIESLITKNKHKLIMDAKFHENVNIESLLNCLYPPLNNNVTELDQKCLNHKNKVDKKNYSENYTNTVFILHPDAKNSIMKMNPSDWGNDAYYGEVDMYQFHWDNDNFPNHKYGAILLSPIKNTTDYGNYLDNLHRLIGMSLQYQLEDNDKKNITSVNSNTIDPIPKEKVFCIKCSSNKITKIFSGFSKSRKGVFYEFKCEECKHSFIYFYCWNCKQRLIKNGSYWSYHSFQPLEPFDIQCPKCAKFWYQNKEHEEHEEHEEIENKKILKQNNNKYKITTFEIYDEAIKYAKEKPNSVLTRNSNGINWIVKEKEL